MAIFYKHDANSGELIPFKLVDNGDGTFSESGSTGSLPTALGQHSSEQSVSVVLASGQISVIAVAVEFTRPGDTTAYTANDVVSNSTVTSALNQVPNFARVNGGGGYIVGARVSTDKKSITPRIRIHLFNASNPTVAADNAAWRDSYADASKRLGYFDMPAMSTGADATNSDMSRSLDMTLRVPFVAAAGTRSIYYLLETLDAFTPASGEKFTVTLYGDID